MEFSFNYLQAFTDIVVRDSELVTVELLASDRKGELQGVVFLGSIKYDALKRVYDSRVCIAVVSGCLLLAWYSCCFYSSSFNTIDHSLS